MNLRKDNTKALNAWKALPPARICHPLRFIRARDTEYSIDAEGVRRTHQGPSILMAEIFAKRGNGAAVQKIAMGFARH